LKPQSQGHQTFGEGGKAFGFVGGDVFLIGSRDGSNDEGFVNVDAAADGIHNLEHTTHSSLKLVRAEPHFHW
jgi:hypothetical protein